MTPTDHTTEPATRPCARTLTDPHTDPASRAAACLLCWLSLHDPDPRVRAKLGGGEWVPPPVPKPRPAGRKFSPGRVTPPTRPPCPHEGPVVTWATCGSDARHVRQCLHDDADWDLCTRGPNNGGAQSCRACPLHPVGNRIVLNMGAGGLGDGLLGLLAVAAVKAESPNAHVVYRVGRAALPFVRLFGGYDELTDHDWDRNGNASPRTGDRQMNDGYTAELRAKGRTPRWVRYLRNAGAAGGPVVPALRDPDGVRAAGAAYAGAILLGPFSAFTDREWPVWRWQALARLLKFAGRRAVVVHNEPERARVFAGEKLIGAPAETVAGAVLNAACVVGLDSGLTHLAGILGAPTLALCGQTRGEQIFGAYPRVTPVYGPLPCNGCHWQPPHHPRDCRPHCPSLKQVTPERVARLIEETTANGRDRESLRPPHARELV
jgi:hypothetical protein